MGTQFHTCTKRAALTPAQTTMAADYFLLEMGLPPTAFTKFGVVPSVTPSREAGKEVLSEESRRVLNGWKEPGVLNRCSEEHPCVVSLISRSRTRRILNEKELMEAMEAAPFIKRVNVIDEGVCLGVLCLVLCVCSTSLYVFMARIGLLTDAT